VLNHDKFGTNNMTNRELESNVLEICFPLITRLYGGFIVNSEQTDRPDFAIDVLNPINTSGGFALPFQIGIEVTTVDPETILEYLINEKHGRSVANQVADDLFNKNITTQRPLKKINIRVGSDYIYLGARKKFNKYLEYSRMGSFKELILLCFSRQIQANSNAFLQYLRPWSNYLLSVNNCPFDKVLFVSMLDERAEQIYDKSQPLLFAPSSRLSDFSVTAVHGSPVKAGEPCNLNHYFDGAPLIPYGKKNRRKISK
jgi:hypothetical protein